MIETAIYNVLKQAIEDAPETAALHGAELHDTLYARVSKPYGVRIGDVGAALAPMRGGTEVGEFDAALPLQCFARVQGDTVTARVTARDKARSLAHAVAKIFFDDPMLQGQVRDARALEVVNGWAQVQATPHAVAVLTVLVNETGQQSE